MNKRLVSFFLLTFFFTVTSRAERFWVEFVNSSQGVQLLLKEAGVTEKIWSRDYPAGRPAVFEYSPYKNSNLVAFDYKKFDNEAQCLVVIRLSSSVAKGYGIYPDLSQSSRRTEECFLKNWDGSNYLIRMFSLKGDKWKIQFSAYLSTIWPNYLTAPIDSVEIVSLNNYRVNYGVQRFPLVVAQSASINMPLKYRKEDQEFYIVMFDKRQKFSGDVLFDPDKNHLYLKGAKLGLINNFWSNRFNEFSVLKEPSFRLQKEKLEFSSQYEGEVHSPKYVQPAKGVFKGLFEVVRYDQRKLLSEEEISKATMFIEDKQLRENARKKTLKGARISPFYFETLDSYFKE